MTMTNRINIFDQKDIGETKLDKWITEFDYMELLDYVQFMYRKVYRTPYNGHFYKDQAVCRRMLNAYGSEGPRMVKFLFHLHRQYRGEPFRLSFFSIGCRWITDDIAKMLADYDRSFDSTDSLVASTGLRSLSSMRERLGA